VGRDLGERVEVALAVLLLAADLVELDGLDPDRVVEVGVGGSLKARWPFSPKPSATASAG
jgi:hypothetical protein